MGPVSPYVCPDFPNATSFDATPNPAAPLCGASITYRQRTRGIVSRPRGFQKDAPYRKDCDDMGVFYRETLAKWETDHGYASRWDNRILTVPSIILSFYWYPWRRRLSGASSTSVPITIRADYRCRMRDQSPPAFCRCGSEISISGKSLGDCTKTC